MQITFSIVTPTLNAEKYLQRNILSVKSQKIEDIEHILIDGISTDGTKEIIDNNRDHFSKIIVEKDDGIYDAMNKGISLANGDIVVILNADDTLLPGCLKHVRSVYKKTTNKNSIMYGDMYKEYCALKTLSRSDMTPRAFVSGKYTINHAAIFVPKVVYNKIGKFSKNFPSGADQEFMLRAYFAGINYIKIEKALAVFSMGGFTSSFSLRIIFSRTKEAFLLGKLYYGSGFAFWRSADVFFRMLRNYILINLIGEKRFLAARIMHIDRKSSK